ncbi:hypothetical protein MKW98_029238 [Papaver atlanticum]|uniref:Amino acid transporter transmembrane domain-containing protein n=1 Tax=Papaver atlanticum TaxID=357466 RepID=A0AAD4T2X2_9MAGN|nr:hypothetical protein MKW98_029238 [Papaver atlanticum]
MNTGGRASSNSSPIAVRAGDHSQIQYEKELDAGALFVLKSKGSWIHCGYYLTTSIVAPPLLSLPFAFASLGWVAGVICLTMGAIITFYVGCLLLVMAQILSFHSLRHINLISLVLCLAYSMCATAGSIYIRFSSNAPPKDYTVKGSTINTVFGVFNAVAIISTTFGNGIIPEIQATLAPPLKGKMLKGLSVCYSTVIVTFFSVAISGFWAFGNNAGGIIISNFMDENGRSLVPKWYLLFTNVLLLLQLSAVSVVYLQPTNELLEKTFSDPKSGEFSARNVIPRLISRSLSVLLAVTIATMLPFFGDIIALIGALWFTPLDFVLPFIFFNHTFKPSIAVFFSIFAIIAAVAPVRQITLDATNYRLFANV